MCQLMLFLYTDLVKYYFSTQVQFVILHTYSNCVVPEKFIPCPTEGFLGWRPLPDPPKNV